MIRVKTITLQGLQVLPVDVQISVTSGMPGFYIVGLADKAVAESRERVRSALMSMGLSLPQSRITINLSPADLLKEGSHFDLPIAVGLLGSMGVFPSDILNEYLVMGELALDGRVIAVNGVLPAALEASRQGLGIICPHEQGAEAAWVGQIPILAVPDLMRLIHHIKGSSVLPDPKPVIHTKAFHYVDFSDIRGQETAKRVMEIAAAGGHHMLMMGPPGSGKSMLAKRLVTILPPLTPSEILEVSMVHSVAGMLKNGQLTSVRPYRDPHHSASLASLVGGGTKAKPGEVSLSHRGVLFMDEWPEFARPVLEALRQPIETGEVTVARANAHVTYPAQFQLIAAMNPCRCGYLSDASKTCGRAPQCGVDYQNKISGPLWDRMDLVLDVPAVKALDLTQAPSKEGSADMAKRVLKARQIQAGRYESETMINARLDPHRIDLWMKFGEAEKNLIEKILEKLQLSARSYHRMLKVARTIADLDDSEVVKSDHLMEAFSYRRLSYQSSSNQSIRVA